MARIIINADKIVRNFGYAKYLCDKHSRELVVVTKCCASDMFIVNHLIDAGALSIADSHISRLKNIGKNAVITALQVSLSSLDMILSCDYAHITELTILQNISKCSLSDHCRIILPVEAGDLREGIPPNHLISFMKSAVTIPDIHIAGFSINFGCMQWCPPDIDAIRSFVRYIGQISDALNFQPEILSLGGSTVWSLLEKNLIPHEINQIRLGETIFLGYDPGQKLYVENLYKDALVLEGEIIEIKDKEVNQNFFSDNIRRPHCRIRKRAVLDFGYTSCHYTGLTPLRKGIGLVGSSQDHTVIDITDSECQFSVGDHVEFLMDYKSLCGVMISPYIKKIYTDDCNRSLSHGK